MRTKDVQLKWKVLILHSSFSFKFTSRFRAQPWNRNQCDVLRRVATRSREPVRVLLLKSDRSPAAAPAKVTRDKSPPLQSPAISTSPLLLHPTSSFTSACFCCVDEDRALSSAGDRKHLYNIREVDVAAENFYFNQWVFFPAESVPSRVTGQRLFLITRKEIDELMRFKGKALFGFHLGCSAQHKTESMRVFCDCAPTEG